MTLRQLDRYQAELGRLRGSVVRRLESAWRRVGSDFSNDAATRFAGNVAPVVEGGQRAVAATTVAYFAARGVEAEFEIENVIGAAARNGTPLADVYQRPFGRVRRALAQGLPAIVASNQGLARVQALSATDLQLSQIRTAAGAMQGSGVSTYRRVLTSGNSCELCLLASAETYRSENLMSIHERCSCTVEPDSEFASTAVGQRADTVTTDKRADRITTKEHGELGTLLVADR